VPSVDASSTHDQLDDVIALVEGAADRLLDVARPVLHGHDHADRRRRFRHSVRSSSCEDFRRSDSITDARRAQQGPQSLVNALSILESVRAGADNARMIFR
jgi:hypothetical protein